MSAEGRQLGPHEGLQRRRELLRVEAKPRQELDYAIQLTRELPRFVLTGERGISPILTLRYVPDREILVPEALEPYLGALAADPFSSTAELATALFDDCVDRLVARWLGLRLALADGAESIFLEDRQPDWDNRSLLARLEPL